MDTINPLWAGQKLNPQTKILEMKKLRPRCRICLIHLGMKSRFLRIDRCRAVDNGSGSWMELKLSSEARKKKAWLDTRVSDLEAKCFLAVSIREFTSDYNSCEHKYVTEWT